MNEPQTSVHEDDGNYSNAIPEPTSRGTLRQRAIAALPSSVIFWYFTTILVLIGVSFGLEQVTLERTHESSATRVDWWSSFATWDGEWYVGIVDHSYAIPLWFQATRTCMMSQSRYASVIFPTYIVLGKILSRLPASLATILCTTSGLLLGLYTAMFVSWHWFY